MAACSSRTHKLSFVRTSLRELAERIFGDVDDDLGAAANCRLVVRRKAVA
jgi:hypothetical protein